MTIEESIEAHKKALEPLFINCRDFISGHKNEIIYSAICHHIELMETRLNERERIQNGINE